MTKDDRRELSKEFHEIVNMSVKELEKWLDDPKSLETGQAAEDGEPKGAALVAASGSRSLWSADTLYPASK